MKISLHVPDSINHIKNDHVLQRSPELTWLYCSSEYIKRFFTLVIPFKKLQPYIMTPPPPKPNVVMTKPNLNPHSFKLSLYFPIFMHHVKLYQIPRF